MSKNGSLIASEILIVDDEEDIRDLIAGILHDEGYSTRVAGDSESALADIEGGEGAEVTLTFPFTQKDMRQKGVEDEQKRIADRV